MCFDSFQFSQTLYSCLWGIMIPYGVVAIGANHRGNISIYIYIFYQYGLKILQLITLTMKINADSMKSDTSHSKIIRQVHQIKNHQYYHNNYNIWNNPHQTSSKNYQFYHEGQDQQNQHIQDLTQDHQQSIAQMQQCIRESNIQDRDEDLQRLQSRKSERQDLEASTRQGGSREISRYKSLNRTNLTLTGRADLPWNKISNLSKKYMKAVCTPKVLKMEDEAIQFIQNKIDQKNNQDEQKEMDRAQVINDLRGLFLFQHKRNYNKEVYYGLVPEVKPRIIKMRAKLSSQLINTRSQTSQGDRTQQSNNQASLMYSQTSTIKHSLNQAQDEGSKIGNKTFQSQLNSIESDLNLNRKSTPLTGITTTEQKSPTGYFPQKYVSNCQYINNINTSERTNMLAQSRGPRLVSPRNHLDRTEFKGLIKVDFENQLQKEPDRQIGTPYSLLRINSVKSPTNYEKPDPDLLLAMSQIDEFEKKTSFQKRKVGFPKVALNDIK